MDINSLLSPSDAPPSQEPSATATGKKASTETSKRPGRKRAPTSAASTASSSQSQYSQSTAHSQQSVQVSSTGTLQRPLPAHIHVPPAPVSPSRHAALQQQSQSQSQSQSQQQQQQQQQHWANMPSPAGSNFSSAGGTYSPRSYTNPQSAVATPPPMERTGSQQRPPLHRNPTSGMDTLADLASMQQQHQQVISRPNVPQRQDSGHSIGSSSRPSLEHFKRMHSGSRGSIDMSMLDSVPKPPVHKARRLASASLTPDELHEASKLFEHLFDNQHAYRSHLQLVNILRKGFRKHIYGEAGEKVAAGELRNDPRSYELVKELQEANEAMVSLFAIGEELWLEQLHDQQLLAHSVEDCVAVMEACYKAVSQEPGSTALWHLFGTWVTTIYRASNGLEPDASSEHYTKFSKWSADEKTDARELFGRQSVLDVWQKASHDTTNNIYDSHLIWDIYLTLLTDDLDRTPSEQGLANVREVFERRLQTPHRGWESTFQQFSQFVSKHLQQSAYEQTMVRVQQMSQMAKLQYNDREPFEMRWQQARQSGDKTAEGQTLYEYLEWELGRNRKKRGHFSLELCRTLHQRALLRFPLYVELWEDYAMFLADELPTGVLSQQMLPVIERATSHCPWSGKLWAHYIRAGELVNLSFEEMSQIKHKATSEGLLDDSPLDEHLAIKTTWCSYLRRRAFSRRPAPEEEELDVTEVGIRSALEDLEMLGRQRHGSDYQGDPHYRLERIYIRFCTQVGDGVYIQTARDMWKRLTARCGHSYEFWQWYFLWERYIWTKDLNNNSNRDSNPTPRNATSVLMQGLSAPNLDWPEKLIDDLLQHAEDYEDPAGQLAAMVAARKARKAVEKRRSEERAQAEQQQQSAVEQQQVQQVQQVQGQGQVQGQVQGQGEAPGQGQQERGQRAGVHLEVSQGGEAESSGQAGKRKRAAVEGQEDSATKKARSTDPDDDVIMTTAASPSNEASQVKRDRENATVTVRNLPAGVSEGKIRHFFRDCGTIISVLIVRPGQDAAYGSGASSNSSSSCTAHIEFDSSDDVLVAQTRDMKSFEGNPISVQVGSGTTLYCANYPAVADEAYIRSLFASFGDILDIRFPSLKYNAHRRFCYVQFSSSAQASAASSALDGKELEVKDGEAKLNLIAKLSDPSNKKVRSSALEEGREVHIRNLDWLVTEDELLKPFQKYGKVERVRIPRNMAGKSKGIAFVTFTKAEDATAALDLDDTKLRTRLMKVTIASKVEAKRISTTVIERSRGSASPSPSMSQQAGESEAPEAAPNGTTNSREDIASRTIALLGVPDTVNDARIRAITESHGRLFKIILRPDHAGAIVEFAETSGAGKASMALEGFEISPGRSIRVGSIQELMASKPERHTSERLAGPKKEKDNAGGRAQAGSLGSGFVKRPGAGTSKRGGLGVKRGAPAGRNAANAAPNGRSDDGSAEGGDANGTGKSNADFRAMISQGKKT